MKKVTTICIAMLGLGIQHLAIAGGDYGQPDFNDSLRKQKDLEEFMHETEGKNLNTARKEFFQAFSAAQEALAADKLDKAKTAIEKLHKTPKPNKYEEARIDLADYWYQGKLGNKDAENEAATKLLEIGMGNIDPEAYVEAGIRLLKRQYNSQNYGAAIDTLASLRKEPKSQPELDAVATAVKKLDDMSSPTQDIFVQIKTDDKGKWSTKLLRSTFFFDKINGEISTVDFDCTNKKASIPYKVESVMSTPAAWGSCSIKVNATPNTTFNFAQTTQKAGS